MEHNEEKQPEKKTFHLPLQVISKGDLSRVTREVEDLDQFFTQASLKGADAKTVPQASLQLNALTEINDLNLLNKEDRTKLRQFLKLVVERAPVVHASFATDPKPDFLMKILAWFREQAHPYVLLQVGLQPSIAVGCVIRTPNKYFDLGFQQHFKKTKLKLVETMRKVA